MSRTSEEITRGEGRRERREKEEEKSGGEALKGLVGKKALGTVKRCIYVPVLCLYSNSPKFEYYSALRRKENVTGAFLLTFLRLIDCLTDWLMLWFPAENKMMF